jgi:putative restriction endonuclease
VSTPTPRYSDLFDSLDGDSLRKLVHALLRESIEQWYVTITPEYSVQVSPRLKLDYQNGHSYYPLHGSEVSLPASSA